MKKTTQLFKMFLVLFVCLALVRTSDFNASDFSAITSEKANLSSDSTFSFSKESSINSIKTPDGLLLYYDGLDISEIYDENNSECYYDSDDFDSLEEYYEYCEKSNVEKKPLRVSPREIQNTPTTTVSGVCKFELIHNNAIQSFAYDGNEIYISQAYVNLNFNGVSYPIDSDNPDNLVLITKCKKKTGDSKTYVPDSYMLLKGVGHGQTLEVYKHNNKKYLLISCTGQKLPKSPRNRWWSTQIGRVEFTPNAVIENSQIKRITHLEGIASIPNDFGSVKRVDGSLSENGKKLLIWVKSKSQGKEMYAGYDFNTVNALWDNSNELSLLNNSQLQNANEFSFTKSFETQDSMQGLSMSNISNKKYTIYNSSGNEANEEINYIYSYESTGLDNSLKGVIIDDTGVWSLCNKDYKNRNINAEIEGVKLKSGYLHFVLRDAENEIGKVQILAKIGKSKLKKLN